MMKFLIFSFSFLIAGLSYADQIKDFGPGLSASELRSEGYNSRIEGNKTIFEKKNNVLIARVVSAKGFYVSAMMSHEQTNEISYVELEKKGKALSRTKCSYDKKSDKYSCSTQTNSYCKALVPLIAQGEISGDLKKLKECDSILAKIPYNSTEILRAQKLGIENIQKDFEIPQSKITAQVPSRVLSLSMLMNDYHECRSMESAWFGSRWADTNSTVSSQNEKSPSGVR